MLGGGHAHVEVLRRFAADPPPDARLTLVTREAATPYSGLLPALLRGEVTYRQAHVELGPLAEAAQARLVVAPAEAIDLAAGRVTVEGFPPVPFDILSLDVGGVLPTVEGALPVKPIGGFLAHLPAIERDFPLGATIAVVGSGAGGTELALALAHRFAGQARIILVGEAAEAVPAAPAAARRHVADALRHAGVDSIAGTAAIRHADGVLHLADARRIPCLAAVWASGIVAPAFLAASGLACDADGCVLVDATLRSISDQRVFAAGDCAARANHPHPKAGVWAVRAGPPLADNLRRAAAGLPLRPWRAQSEALVILGTGDGRAVAWRGRHSLSGRLPALWKSLIDRRWMRRYQHPAAR